MVAIIRANFGDAIPPSLETSEISSGCGIISKPDLLVYSVFKAMDEEYIWELDRSHELGTSTHENFDCMWRVLPIALAPALQSRFLLLRCLRSRSPSPVLSVVHPSAL